MAQEGGREEIYISLWLIHTDVQQTPSQHCKAIILQLKIHKCTGKKNLICNLPHQSLYYFLKLCAAAAAKSLQSCLTLCDPIDGSPPGSPVPGILQARTLEWVAISFSNAWKWKVKVKSLSRVRLLATPWTAAYQAPLPTGFSRQEYGSGLPFESTIISTFKN